MYRFASAYQGAIRKMLQKSWVCAGVGVVAGLLLHSAAARSGDVVWYKTMPAIIPAPATTFGLYRGTDFRLTKGACKDCTTSQQALWYFRDELLLVPSDGVPTAGFTPGISAQEDVKRWYASATPEDLQARPPLLWVGSSHKARNVTLVDGDVLRFKDGHDVPFKTVDKIKTNQSYYDSGSKAYFQQRTLRLRGESRDGAFVARTIWPEDWALDEKPLRVQALQPGESLLGLVRKYRSARDERFETRLLWEKTPGEARDWSGRAVIGILLNGAQGDDDEAHGGHFAIATGRHGKGSEMADWTVNNFYNLASHSEKGIIASMLPMDNYLADLNSGQSWYRPSYMLVAVLKNDRAAFAYQAAIARVYQHLYRQGFQYSHASANCAGISMDTLRTLGWNIPLQGPTSTAKAIAAYPLKSFTDKSFASGKQAYDYLIEEQSRLYPAAAYDAAGRDLLRIAAGGASASTLTDAKALDTLLREDLEALVFVRIPQLPSSLAFCSYPVASIDEYLKRAPEDKAQWKIVPVEPRPFPQALMAADVAPARPMPPWAPAAGALALLGGLVGVGAMRMMRKRRARSEDVKPD